MQEPVPKGIIKFPDQQTSKMQAQMAAESTKAGYPATPQSVNPNSLVPLQDIADKFGDLARVVGGTVDENFGGTNAQTHTGTTEGTKGLSIASIRNRLKKAA